MEGEGDLVERVTETIAEEGLTQEGFGVRGMRKTYFQEGNQACLLQLGDLDVSGP